MKKKRREIKREVRISRQVEGSGKFFSKLEGPYRCTTGDGEVAQTHSASLSEHIIFYDSLKQFLSAHFVFKKESSSLW